jgi:hypothetical protein
VAKKRENAPRKAKIIGFFIGFLVWVILAGKRRIPKPVIDCFDGEGSDDRTGQSI